MYILRNGLKSCEWTCAGAIPVLVFLSPSLVWTHNASCARHYTRDITRRIKPQIFAQVRQDSADRDNAALAEEALISVRKDNESSGAANFKTASVLES